MATPDTLPEDSKLAPDEAAEKSTLAVTDQRTDEQYELPITDGTIRAADLRQIKTSEDDFGLMSYDPAFFNTASCRSAITYIDGDKGILEYRGYPIQELAKHTTYLESAYLLIHGTLPTSSELNQWEEEIRMHTMVHESVQGFMGGFRYDAHPMGILLATIGELSTFYPDAKRTNDPQERHMATVRLIAKIPTIAAWAYRHKLGYPYVYPDNELSYTENFLSMMYKMMERQYVPDERLSKALDTFFILHADHEQNCSTSAVRAVGSSGVDPYSAVSAGIAALYGPAHGGANEAAMKMIERVGSVENVASFIESVKRGEEKMMGFGHRVYKNYDPRATIVKELTSEVFAVTGVNPKLKIALELEKHALEDEYFVTRKLYPNVDFYSGLIYEALGLPSEMFTVMFAIPRTSGWMAQWRESLDDPENKISRPRQIYTGAREQTIVPIEQRR